MPDPALMPILALILWSFVIWLWMYATRLPAMQKARIDPQAAAHPGSLAQLPSSVRRVADNYNHLMEQPTLFYALAVYLHLGERADAANVGLLWAYVGLRVVHSIVQCTLNLVPARFLLFVVSSLCLFGIAVREGLHVVGIG